MIKQNKKLLLLTSVITLLPVFIGLFLWNQLPDSVATHFGVNYSATKLPEHLKPGGIPPFFGVRP